MRKVAVITIDLDDTLWPVAPVIADAEYRLGQWLREKFPKITDQAPALQLREALLERYPLQRHDFAFLRKKMIESLLVESGYDSEHALEAYDVFFSARNNVALFPDVRPALQWLSTQFRVIALTNGNADLQRIGIDTFFSATIRAAEVGAAKPDAAIFAAAIDAAAVEPECILHIGDAPIEDVAGAAEAGMQTAWMNRFGRRWPEGHVPANLTITSLTDLLPVLHRR